MKKSIVKKNINEALYDPSTHGDKSEFINSNLDKIYSFVNNRVPDFLWFPEFYDEDDGYTRIIFVITTDKEIRNLLKIDEEVVNLVIHNAEMEVEELAKSFFPSNAGIKTDVRIDQDGDGPYELLLSVKTKLKAIDEVNPNLVIELYKRLISRGLKIRKSLIDKIEKGELD
jgi:hypothetical protein